LFRPKRIKPATASLHRAFTRGRLPFYLSIFVYKQISGLFPVPPLRVLAGPKSPFAYKKQPHRAVFLPLRGTFAQLMNPWFKTSHAEYLYSA